MALSNDPNYGGQQASGQPGQSQSRAMSGSIDLPAPPAIPALPDVSTGPQFLRNQPPSPAITDVSSAVATGANAANTAATAADAQAAAANAGKTAGAGTGGFGDLNGLMNALGMDPAIQKQYADMQQQYLNVYLPLLQQQQQLQADLSRAQMTGDYKGVETLQAKLQENQIQLAQQQNAMNQVLQASSATGMYGNTPTMQYQNLMNQMALEEGNQNLTARGQDLSAMGLGAQYGLGMNNLYGNEALGFGSQQAGLFNTGAGYAQGLGQLGEGYGQLQAGLLNTGAGLTQGLGQIGAQYNQGENQALQTGGQFLQGLGQLGTAYNQGANTALQTGAGLTQGLGQLGAAYGQGENTALQTGAGLQQGLGQLGAGYAGQLSGLLGSEAGYGVQMQQLQNQMAQSPLVAWYTARGLPPPASAIQSPASAPAFGQYESQIANLMNQYGQQGAGQGGGNPLLNQISGAAAALGAQGAGYAGQGMTGSNPFAQELSGAAGQMLGQGAGYAGQGMTGSNPFSQQAAGVVNQQGRQGQGFADQSLYGTNPLAQRIGSAADQAGGLSGSFGNQVLSGSNPLAQQMSGAAGQAGQNQQQAFEALMRAKDPNFNLGNYTPPGLSWATQPNNPNAPQPAIKMPGPDDVTKMFNDIKGSYQQLRLQGRTWTPTDFANLLGKYGYPPSLAQAMWNANQEYEKANPNNPADANEFGGIMQQVIADYNRNSGLVGLPGMGGASPNPPTSSYTPPTPGSLGGPDQWVQMPRQQGGAAPGGGLRLDQITGIQRDPNTMGGGALGGMLGNGNGLVSAPPGGYQPYQFRPLFAR